MQQDDFKAAMDRYLKALRANDTITQLRIVNENIAAFTGAERAAWLRRRALLGLIMGAKLQAQADLEEAERLSPGELSVLITPYVEPAYLSGTLEPLRDVPVWLRRRVWRERSLRCDLWFYWSRFQHLRRRWYQSYRAVGMAIDSLAAMPPAERQNYEGWFYVYRANRARYGMRCGRRQEVEADLRVAEEMAKVRKHLHPWDLGMAKGELHLERGEFQAAKRVIHEFLARMAELPPTLPMTDPYQVEVDLLAARIARAEGNQVGFDHFCGKALALCLEKRIGWLDLHVRAVMAGEPF